MPSSGATAYTEAEMEFSPASTTLSSLGVPSSNFYPNNDTEEVLAVKAVLKGAMLTFVNVYIP